MLSRQLTNAGMAEVAQAAPEAYRLSAEAADVYAWLTRDNFELRQAIFGFLKVSGTCDCPRRPLHNRHRLRWEQHCRRGSQNCWLMLRVHRTSFCQTALL